MRTPRDPCLRLRRLAHAWFAEAPRRLALARLHGQMARLARAEADAIACPYCRAYPGDPGRSCSPEHRLSGMFDELPKHPADVTPEERAQLAHLDDLGAEAFARMERLAPGWSGSFHDFTMGWEDAS